MEKFFKLLYYYLLGMLVLFVLYLTVVLAISPKKDAKKRGFIPCTQNLVLQVGECERGSIQCPLKCLWVDTTCNIGVILDGLGAWVKGEQPTPWATYLFKPIAESQVDEGEPYEGDVLEDMADLEDQSQFFKQKQQELEEAKSRELNLDKDVIVPTSDEDVAFESSKFDFKAEDVDISNDDMDISEEAFVDEIDVKTEDEKSENVDSEIRDKVVLQKQEVKVEDSKTKTETEVLETETQKDENSKGEEVDDGNK